MDKEFLSWHYSDGIKFFLSRWKGTLDWIAHYFSLSLLLGSLFSSYKRILDTSNTGMNPNKYFEKLVFNLVSRGVGAVSRLVLFFVGFIFYVLTIFTGILGLAIWYIFPFIGLPFYSKYKKQPVVFATELKKKLVNTQDIAKTIFDNSAGQFVLSRLQITLADVLQAGIEKVSLEDIEPINYSGIVEHFVDSASWPQDYFKQKGVTSQDFIQAASWWDENQSETNKLNPPEEFGRPGIGLELLFGYTPTLNKCSSDLAAPQSYQKHLIGRENVVARLERALTSGNSAMIVGSPGVGKKTVVLEFANKAAKGELGSQMAYRRVLDFDYNALFTNISDSTARKNKLSEVFSEAAVAGNIILVIRDIHRLTNAAVEGMDFTDIFEKFLEKRDLKIIAITTNSEYERFTSQNMRLRKFFDVIEVNSPNKMQAMQILVRAAQDIEFRKNITITVQALRAVLDGSDRYITETPFPEKAIELLDKVITYCEQHQKTIVRSDEVNIVLAEKTGISMSTLTQAEKRQLSNIEDILHEDLINQKTAVELIAKSLRARSAGVRDENRPVGSFLFLGPTGVGKTQTAKVLAKVYFGSETEMIRFDMAEYATSDGISRLIGSQNSNQPGSLTTAIKNKPASLLLFDEIEKAPPEIFNLLLTLLDEGYITDAFGRQVSAKHLFFIATSNAGAEYIRELVNKGVNGQDMQKQVFEYIQKERLFSPELLNRFDGVVVYEPLNRDNLVAVAKLMLRDFANNLQKRNIQLDITDQLAEKVASDGYDPAFGARPMRRVIDLILGDLIGKAILSGEINDGDKIEITPGVNKEEYNLITFS